MSDISPEDRERLARSKYDEWWKENWERTFGEAFDKRVVETHEAAGTQQQTRPPHVSVQRQQQQEGQQERPRRRSLLEMSLSQMMGLP